MPRAVDDHTAEWFTAGLSPAFPGVNVASVSVDEILRGTAIKVLVGLEYGQDQPRGAPSSVCVKGAFGEDQVDMAAASKIYEREAVFYRDFESLLPRPGPIPWFSETEAGTGLGIVVLEDLRTRGATFGRATSPFTVDQVAAGLEVLAGCQTATWGLPLLHQHPVMDTAVSRDNGTGQYFATFDTSGIQYFLDLPLRSEAIPVELHDPELISRLFWAWADQSHDGPYCLSHGDAHIGNWYVVPDGGVGLLDWQVIGRMRWAHDVTYFMTSALDVDDRRSAETDLLRLYLGRLASAVDGAPSFDEAWLDYRRHMAYGLMAWLTSLEWMNPEPIHAAAVGRFAHAVLDLDTEGALAS